MKIQSNQSTVSGISPVSGFAVLTTITLFLAFCVIILTSAITLQPTSPEGVVSIQEKTINQKDGLIIRLQDKQRLDSISVSVTPPVSDYTKIEFNESLVQGESVSYRRSAETLQWASSSQESVVKSVLEPPENTTTVTVDYRVSLSSYEGSGAALYAVYSDGSAEVIHCDGKSDTGVSQASSAAPNTVACTSSENATWTGSTEIKASGKQIEKVVLLTEQDNTPGRFEDVVTLSRFSIEADNQIQEICPTCEEQEFYSRNTPDNTITKVGEGVFITGLKDGSSITVTGEYNGETKVLKQKIYQYEG